MKHVLKYAILFCVFGAIYFAIECIWKWQITHWSMFILAGIIGVLIGRINEHMTWDMSFWTQCGIGMMIAILGECIAGIILNIQLGLNIWHYNIMPFLWGQCSVPFSVAWFFLSGACIIMDDWMRWKWFGEAKPVYH